MGRQTTGAELCCTTQVATDGLRTIGCDGFKCNVLNLIFEPTYEKEPFAAKLISIIFDDTSYAVCVDCMF